MVSVICASCVDFLTTYNSFRERINLYHDMQQRGAIIKLRDLLTFLSEDISYNNINIKKEEVLEKYEGAICDYQIKHERNLKRGTSVHKNISDRQTCESGSKHPEDVRRCLLDPKVNLEAPMYKCEYCEDLIL
ncbi:hypothetical protein NQ317_009147 [Molorchus minor]|uniref:Uncharacterized protein n=1 Tax=Molorchus minor TaxID=1323400 RepID=A0ABQ9K0Q7_9CUCU|nr:hypothetical protein NQ317_009147 [Molorchus minor]